MLPSMQPWLQQQHDYDEPYGMASALYVHPAHQRLEAKLFRRLASRRSNLLLKIVPLFPIAIAMHWYEPCVILAEVHGTRQNLPAASEVA